MFIVFQFLKSYYALSKHDEKTARTFNSTSKTLKPYLNDNEKKRSTKNSHTEKKNPSRSWPLLIPSFGY